MKFVVQQPKKLGALAISKVGDWIALRTETLMMKMDTSNDLLTIEIEAIRHHLDCNVPHMLHNQLVIEAMQALDGLVRKTMAMKVKYYDRLNMFHTIGRMTETFLYTKNLTKLNLRIVGCIVPCAAKSYMLTGLTTLKVFDFDHVQVIPFLKDVHNLKVFKFNYYCTDAVLRCLAKNCKLIEELDLSGGEGKITNKSILIIAKLPHLKSVKLYNTSITQMGIRKLLLSCENIEHIEINSSHEGNLLWAALKSIASTKKHAGRHFKLKYYNDIFHPGPESLQSLVEMCPFLQDVCLLKEWSLPDYLMPLNDLKFLHTLQLGSFHFFEDRVLDILQMKGMQLLDLKLCCLNGINLKALVSILQTCPNLERLTIDFLYVVAPSNEKLPKNFDEILPLSKLQLLTLQGFHPSDNQLFFILSKCPNVELVIINSKITLTDSLLLRVLERNPMRHLEKMYLHKSKLTKPVIDLMIQNCNGLVIIDTVN